MRLHLLALGKEANTKTLILAKNTRLYPRPRDLGADAHSLQLSLELLFTNYIACLLLSELNMVAYKMLKALPKLIHILKEVVLF